MTSPSKGLHFASGHDEVAGIDTAHTLVWRDNDMTSGTSGKSPGGSLSGSQTRAVLIAALVCASISLLLVLIALRWFLIMRRCFRHCLILHLIVSDTMKAVWYFIFPIIVFARGPVATNSSFCQASGFLLAFAIEASDMAILIIAVHSTLCIVKPNNSNGEGGLYHYRKWIIPAWLGPPLVAASLAFVNDSNGYTTAGTFCYLPKRPFWYRLALAWVPRYLIISLILVLYIWIYVYVHVKFRGFDNLRASDSSYDEDTRRRSHLSTKGNDAEQRGADRSQHSILSVAPIPNFVQPQYSSQQPRGDEVLHPLEPWDHMNFVTSKPLEVPPPIGKLEGKDAAGRGWSESTHVQPGDSAGQPISESSSQGLASGLAEPPTKGFGSVGSLAGARANKSAQARVIPNDALKTTRTAIRKQLRYLFIYPLVYLVVWSFPFASNALNYNDYYVQHPVFWLTVVQTIMLSLQAGIDSTMFSCSEKPWRRVDSNSKFSIPFIRRRSRAFLQRRSLREPSIMQSETPARQYESNANPMWWEAEGRRRRDSIWLGTNDNPSSMPTRVRSKSPQKRRHSLHFRMRSSDSGPAFVPKLDPISPEPLSPLEELPQSMASPDVSPGKPDPACTDPSRASREGP